MASDREIPLGRTVSGSATYDPSLLFPIERERARVALGLDGAALPFGGEDVWHAYELSWLEAGGRPRAAVGTIAVAAGSSRMVESKSLKLYLNSLNGSAFASAEEVRTTIAADVAKATQGDVSVAVLPVGDPAFGGSPAPGACIDDADFSEPASTPSAELLARDAGSAAEETLHSHLLRSLCPVTAQPDFATLVVSYRGPRVARGSLLRYVTAFREHQEFHEQCVERIFRDFTVALAPEVLTVHALYTRRGGIAISPWRSSRPGAAPQYRLDRQ